MLVKRAVNFLVIAFAYHMKGKTDMHNRVQLFPFCEQTGATDIARM